MVERQSAKAMVMRAMLTCAGEVGFRNVTAAGVRRRFAGSRLRFYCVFRGRRACFEAAHRAESRRLWDRLARAAACRQAHRPLEAALAELGDFARSEPALARGLLVEPRVAGGAAATRHEELLGRYATALDAALRAPERLPSPPAVSAAFMRRDCRVGARRRARARQAAGIRRRRPGAGGDDRVGLRTAGPVRGDGDGRLSTADRYASSRTRRGAVTSMRKKLAITALTALVVLIAGNGGRDQTARRQHPHHRRRRLRADQAARATTTPRSRSTAAARSRTVSGELPAGHRNDQPRIRPPRLGRDHRPAGLHQGRARGDDGRRGAPPLPRRDRRQGPRPRDRQVPRTGADQGLLADHDLQRAAEGRQPDRPRPRLHDGPGADDVRRPGRDRKNPQGRLRLPDRSEDPEDRRRRRHPDRRLPEDRQAAGPTRASSTATSTPAAKPAACRPAASSPSRTAPPLRAPS